MHDMTLKAFYGSCFLLHYYSGTTRAVYTAATARVWILFCNCAQCPRLKEVCQPHPCENNWKLLRMRTRIVIRHAHLGSGARWLKRDQMMALASGNEKVRQVLINEWREGGRLCSHRTPAINGARIDFGRQWKTQCMLIVQSFVHRRSTVSTRL